MFFIKLSSPSPPFWEVPSSPENVCQTAGVREGVAAGRHEGWRGVGVGPGLQAQSVGCTGRAALCLTCLPAGWSP